MCYELFSSQLVAGVKSSKYIILMFLSLSLLSLSLSLVLSFSRYLSFSFCSLVLLFSFLVFKSMLKMLKTADDDGDVIAAASLQRLLRQRLGGFATGVFRESTSQDGSTQPDGVLVADDVP